MKNQLNLKRLLGSILLYSILYSCNLFAYKGDNSNRAANPSSDLKTNQDNTDYSYPNKTPDEIAQEGIANIEKFLRSAAPLDKCLKTLAKAPAEDLAILYRDMDQPGDKKVYFTDNKNFDNDTKAFLKKMGNITYMKKTGSSTWSFNDKFGEGVCDEYIKVIKQKNISKHKSFIKALTMLRYVGRVVAEGLIENLSDKDPDSLSAFTDLIKNYKFDSIQIHIGLLLHSGVYYEKEEFLKVLLDNKKEEMVKSHLKHLKTQVSVKRKALGGTTLSNDILTKLEALIAKEE